MHPNTLLAALIAFICLGSIQVEADICSAAYGPIKASRIPTHLEFQRDLLPLERRAEFRAAAYEVVTRLDSELMAELTPPPVIRVEFDHQFEFLPRGDHISGFIVHLIPEDNPAFSLYGLHELTLILTHELGHAYFSVNMMPYLDFFKERTRISLEYAQAKNLSYEETQDCKFAIQIPKSLRFETDYEELFADSIGVLFLGKPDLYPRRDFSEIIRAEDWTDSETHRAFNPVRSFIWHHILQKPMTPAEKRLWIRRFHEVLALDVQQKWMNPSLREMSVAESNRRLIERLAEAFKIQIDARFDRPKVSFFRRLFPLPGKPRRAY